MSLALRSLLVTLGIQAYVSLASVAVPVLAPVIATDVGVPARALGVFVGVLYGGSMLAGLLAGSLIDRHGAIRVSQVAVLFAVVGLAFATGPLPLLALASLVMGFGYGPITPASSHILIRTTPPERIALTFSLKQTGVPLGAALAGVLMPPLALALGWRPSLWVLAGVGLVAVLLAQPIRPTLDVGLHVAGGSRLSLGAVFAPLSDYLATPELRELARCGMLYALSQVSLTTFLVAFFALELGMSLVAAGFALSVTTVFAVVGRIVWGAVADRWMPPRLLLGALGVASGVCGAVMYAATGSWPQLALLGLCAAYGAVAIGWNGVQLSEVARCSPSGQAGRMTGASSFVTFSGVLIGPPLFGALEGLTGGYRTGFALIGATSLANGLAMLWRNRSVAAAGKEADPDS